MLKKQTFLLLFLLVHVGLWAKRFCPDQVFICLGATSSEGIGLEGNPTLKDGYCYKWEPAADLDDSNAPNPTLKAKLSTSTTFKVTVVDDNGNMFEDQVNVFVYELKMEIYHPKVMSGGVNVLAGSAGAQTFINIDNDDNDPEFDIDDDMVEGGDNELAKIKARIRFFGADLPTFTGDGTSNKGGALQPQLKNLCLELKPSQGANTVKMWLYETKDTPSNNLFSLQQNRLGTEKDPSGTIWKTAEAWIEGILAHSQQQEAKFQVSIVNVKEPDGKESGKDISNIPCNSATVALTNLAINSIEWSGVGNGGTAAPYTSSVLDCDATGCKVYPDGRYESGVISASKDKVKVKITLSAPPTVDFTLFVKSFDMDDPSQNKADIGIINRPPSGTVTDKLILDPNDDGLVGTYEGGQGLTYTIENDNRAQTNKVGEVIAASKNSVLGSDDVFSVRFEVGVTVVDDIPFKVSQFAGDNYQLYGYCDKKYIATLKNTDKEDMDKIKNVVSPTLRKEVLQVDKFGSKVLTVWRLLHVEYDSMKSFEWDQGDQGNLANLNIIKSISENGAITSSKNVKKIKCLNSLSDEGTIFLDYSSYFDSIILAQKGFGRFQNGDLYIGTNDIKNPPVNLKIANGNIIGNDNKNIILSVNSTVNLIKDKINSKIRNKSKSIIKDVSVVEFIEIKPNVIKWLFLAPLNIDSSFIGGQLILLSIPNKIDSIDLINNFVYTSTINIPLIIYDDDQKSILPENERYLNHLNQTFESCYIRSLSDGKMYSINDIIPFCPNFCPNFENGSSLQQSYLKGLIDSINTKNQSLSNKKNNYWMVHILSSFQGSLERDHDSFKEKSTLSGQTLPISSTNEIKDTIVGKGGYSSLIFLETLRDAGVANTESFTITHEVGHQWGLSHGVDNNSMPLVPEYQNMGIMKPENYTGKFIPRHENLIRSRISSPGSL